MKAKKKRIIVVGVLMGLLLLPIAVETGVYYVTIYRAGGGVSDFSRMPPFMQRLWNFSQREAYRKEAEAYQKSPAYLKQKSYMDYIDKLNREGGRVSYLAMQPPVAHIEFVETSYDELKKEAKSYQAQQFTKDLATRGFASVEAVPTNQIVKDIVHLDGDILIGKSDVETPFLHQVGIVYSNQVLTMLPDAKAPTSMTLEAWYEKFPKSVLLRYTGTDQKAMLAAQYARQFFVEGAGQSIPYGRGKDLRDQSAVDSGALVWQCYFYGANEAFNTLVMSDWMEPTVYMPLDYLYFRERLHLQAVHLENWDK